MASANCWRCLSRPSSTFQVVLPRIPMTSTANFSSSTSFLAVAKKAPGSSTRTIKAGVRPSTKGNKSLRIKKKIPVKTGKPPAPGERKAMRKRIVLSNTNALEVQGMREFDSNHVDEIVNLSGKAEIGTEVKKIGLLGEDLGPVGKVVGLDGVTVDSLRVVEAFKTTQGWKLFRRPGMLIREESVTLIGKMSDARKKKQALRLVVDGEKGTGKSLLLLQAMATAFVKGWVVINIPEAQDVTGAATEYAPVPNTKPTLYSQNTYIANMLSQISKANSRVLDGLQISQEHANLPIPIQSNISLTRLCELGGRDPDIAWAIFQAFWQEITLPGRPPVLFALDSLSHIMGNSLYRSSTFDPVHAHDLAIIRHFTKLLSGESNLPNGGAILAATSRSHAPLSTSLTLALKQQEDRQAGREITKKDPFEKTYDLRAEKVMSGVELLKLKGLSRMEARGLMEYWAASGVLRSRVDEKRVAESWALAGNGFVGEIERGALMMRI